MMQASGRTEMQLMASSGGGAGMFPFPGQMGYGNGGGPYPSSMMMPNMNYFPQATALYGQPPSSAECFL